MNTTTRNINGGTVRALREAVGIKHGVLAAAAGISPGYLTNIEKGLRQPSASVMRAIADRLAVPLDAITYPAESA